MRPVSCATCGYAFAVSDVRTPCPQCRLATWVEPLGRAESLALDKKFRQAFHCMHGVPESGKDCLQCHGAKLAKTAPAKTCGYCSTDLSNCTYHICRGETEALRGRVAELEAEQKDSGYAAELDAAVKVYTDRFAEDLRRKRDECEKLECLLGDMRTQMVRVANERDDARRALADADVELRKMRREMGRKR